MKEYFVYIMTNYAKTVLYTGVTNNLIRRIAEHKSEKFEGFTKQYHLTTLIFYQSFNEINDAIASEKKIKGWTRKKKIDLINSINPTWENLAEKILR